MLSVNGTVTFSIGDHIKHNGYRAINLQSVKSLQHKKPQHITRIFANSCIL